MKVVHEILVDFRWFWYVVFTKYGVNAAVCINTFIIYNEAVYDTEETSWEKARRLAKEDKNNE